MIETKKSICTNQMELLLFARQAKLAADFEQITSWARHARYADVETAMNQVKAHLRSSYSKRTFFKRERKPGSMINETKRVWFRSHSCSHVQFGKIMIILFFPSQPLQHLMTTTLSSLIAPLNSFPRVGYLRSKLGR